MAEEATPTATPAQDSAPADARQVLLQKIYLKDVSLESPGAPQVFSRQWQPQVDVNVSTSATPVGQDQFNVVLSITVTAKLDNDVAFLVEVQQAGLFMVRGFTNEIERGAALGAYCPNTLFPYARQTVSELVTNAGFPPLLLQPINFDALYLEHLNRARAQAQRSNGAAEAGETGEA